MEPGNSKIHTKETLRVREDSFNGASPMGMNRLQFECVIYIASISTCVYRAFVNFPQLGLNKRRSIIYV